MPEGLKVSSIELTTEDGTEVKLTIEQARELHAQLDLLFGEKRRKFDFPVPVPQPWPVPVYPLPRPILVPDDYGPWRRRWEITCGSTSLSAKDKSGLTVSYRGEPTS